MSARPAEFESGPSGPDSQVSGIPEDVSVPGTLISIWRNGASCPAKLSLVYCLPAFRSTRCLTDPNTEHMISKPNGFVSACDLLSPQAFGQTCWTPRKYSLSIFACSLGVFT